MKSGALARDAADADVTVHGFDDVADDGETEAGTVADFLGGEERVEDAAGDFGGHARPGVGDVEPEITPFGETVGIAGVEEFFREADGDTAGLFAQGVDGVFHQVHDDFIDADGVGGKFADVAVVVGLQLDLRR